MKKHILLLFLLVGGSLAVKGQSTDNVDLMFPNLMMRRKAIILLRVHTLSR